MNASDPLRMMSRQPSIVHFPKLLHAADLSGYMDEPFQPVLKNKRYNLLKLKELRELHKKDIRMGRVDSL
jgi:hypothetical protein